MNHSEQHCKCNECSCCCTKKIISTVAGCLKAHFNEIVHFIVLALLSVYVFKNWETCISMQFFSRFDGNNILFLVWIVLIFLIIYEVEGKGFKVAKRKQEKVQQNLSDVSLQYKIDAMLSQTKSSYSNLDNTNQNKEGEGGE